jgi:hypothetical protein
MAKIIRVESYIKNGYVYNIKFYDNQTVDIKVQKQEFSTENLWASVNLDDYKLIIKELDSTILENQEKGL